MRNVMIMRIIFTLLNEYHILADMITTWYAPRILIRSNEYFMIESLSSRQSLLQPSISWAAAFAYIEDVSTVLYKVTYEYQVPYNILITF